MWIDPIVEEVRKYRNEHAAKFNYDLNAIYRDIKESEKASGRTFVSFPPQKVGIEGLAEALSHIPDVEPDEEDRL